MTCYCNEYCIEKPNDDLLGDDSNYSNQTHRLQSRTFTYREFCKNVRERFLIMRKLWAAPITKFYFHLIAYVIFLLVLGIATLWPSCGNLFIDSLIGIWVCLMTAEISRCTYLNYSTSNGHLRITRNVVDICIHSIFLIAFVWTRLFGNWTGDVNILQAKFVMCMGVLFFTYRVPFVYLAISETLGPQLVWLEYTIKHEFADFVKLLLLVTFAGAVTINSIIYPFWPIEKNTAFGRIIARSFLAMFLTEKSDLEYDADRTCVPPYLDPEICLDQSAGTQTFTKIGRFTPNNMAYEALNFTVTCPTQSEMGWFFTLQHFIIMKLFLMTMLYAMFNSSSLRISKYSSIVWMFKRYENVMSFKTTSTLPPPLNIIYYVWSLLRFMENSIRKSFIYLRSRCCRKSNRKEEGNGSNATSFAKRLAEYFRRLGSFVFSFVRHSSGDSGMLILQTKESANNLDGDKSNQGPLLNENFNMMRNRPVSSKDGNYWRRLANEYIVKHEEGLLTGSNEQASYEDPLTLIQKRLVGESSPSFNHAYQFEGLRSTVNQMKDQVGAVLKAVDRLAERVQISQEDISKLTETMNINKDSIESDINSFKKDLRTVIVQCHLDNNHTYTDTLEYILANYERVKWNDVDTVVLPCGIEKKIDRRSWQIDHKTGLPIIYAISITTHLPICPWIDEPLVDVSGQMKLPVGCNTFGPNHEINLIIYRVHQTNNEIECFTIKDNNRGVDGIQCLPSRPIHDPASGLEREIAIGILQAISPTAAVVFHPKRLWRGFVSNSFRNCNYCWIEAEYWACDMAEVAPCYDLILNELVSSCESASWVTIFNEKVVPKEVKESLISIAGVQVTLIETS